MSRYLVLLFSSVLSGYFVQAQQTSPAKKVAIICLTYDDGLATQLTTVLPQLDSFEFKGTFFLNAIAGSSPSSTIGQAPESVIGWTQAARNGHELGNHTLFHPCPEKLGWPPTLSLEQYTLNKLLEEVQLQQRILDVLDPGKKQRSFAYPCNQLTLGKVAYGSVLKSKGLISYARAGGDSLSVVVNPSTINPLEVPSWHVWTETTGRQLISFAEKVVKAGGLGVYQFHGVGGQIFSISPEAHRELLQYLAHHKGDVLVLTFSDAMHRIFTGRSALPPHAEVMEQKGND